MRDRLQLKNYGVLNNSCLKQNKKRVLYTLIEHYGSLQNFYNERNLKTEKTCLEKYGTKHFSQKEIIKKKRAQTCLKKYGVTTVLNTKEVRVKNNINSHTKKANQKRIKSFLKNDLKKLKEKKRKNLLRKIWC